MMIRSLTYYIAQVPNSAIGLPETPADTSSIQTILQIIFGVIGALAVLFIVVGGFKLTMSEGDPQKIAKARGTVIYSVVGLIVALLAEVIVTYVLDTI